MVRISCWEQYGLLWKRGKDCSFYSSDFKITWIDRKRVRAADTAVVIESLESIFTHQLFLWILLMIK